LEGTKLEQKDEEESGREMEHSVVVRGSSLCKVPEAGGRPRLECPMEGR
jgi:hypothetical protein